MKSHIFDISFKRNKFCRKPEDFIEKYFYSSYYHLTYLTSDYTIHSYNNTNFNSQTVYEEIGWHFLNLNSVFSVIRLSKRINSQKSSIIFLHGFTSPLQVLLLKFFCTKYSKFIVQHHAERPFEPGLKSFLQKFAYRNLNAYIFTSRQLADQYFRANIMNESSDIYEIMEGSTLFKLGENGQGKNSQNPVIKKLIWVGRLDSNKDPLTAIKALKIYRDNGGKFKLDMIYGENGLENEVKDYIMKHELLEDIILIGKIDHHELEALYNNSDFFISASHYEGSGYAFCEAMACGCIPIVTDIPSFRVMSNNGSLGKLYQPGNVQDLYKKLTESDDIEIIEQRIKVRSHFDAQLSFQAIANKLKNVLMEI